MVVLKDLRIWQCLLQRKILIFLPATCSAAAAAYMYVYQVRRHTSSPELT
jgi:hypothetical protein